MPTKITKNSISFVERLIKKRFKKCNTWLERKEVINIAKSYQLYDLAHKLLKKSI